MTTVVWAVLGTGLGISVLGLAWHTWLISRLAGITFFNLHAIKFLHRRMDRHVGEWQREEEDRHG